MTSDKGYPIDILSLSQGEQIISFVLDDEYFCSVEKCDILSGNVLVDAVVNNSRLKTTLTLSLSGSVNLVCDRCLEPCSYKIDSQDSYNIYLADEDDEDINSLSVSRKTGKLDIGWVAYEQIVTGLPLVHCHQEGECNPLMEDLLRSHQGNNE